MTSITPGDHRFPGGSPHQPSYHTSTIMTTEKQNAITLAKKLKALAEHQTAFDGESRNAQLLFEKTLERHGLTLADLEDEKIETYLFKVRSNHERKFFAQIFASVVGHDWAAKNCRIVKNINRRANNLKPTDIIIEIKCAAHEKVLTHERWSVYWVHYQKELELFYTAYIQKNELYSNPERTTPDDDKMVDLDKLKRLNRMMNGIEKKELIRGIDATAGDGEK